MNHHANGKAAKSDPIGEEPAKRSRAAPTSEYADDHPPEALGFTTAERAQIAGWESSGRASRRDGHGHFEAPSQQGEGSLPLLYYANISPALDAADFIEDLLIEGAMSVLYGESGCGKTFFALDLALHVAAGLPWRGRQVDRGGVLYLALEGSHGIRNRVCAFKAANCAGDADLPFAVVPVSVNLLDDPDADTEKVIAAAKAAAAKLGVPIKLIVVDTLSRALAGGNENDPKDMGALVRNIDHIRQQLPAHVVLVPHR